MSLMMYQEQLMDHYRFPRNRMECENADFTSSDNNPSCGDRIQFQGIIRPGGVAQKLCFDGEGCILSQATASMLIEELEGKTLDEITSFSQQDLLNLVGVPLGPNRIKCALLPLYVLQSGVAKLIEKVKSN